MVKKVILDDVSIPITDFHEDTVPDKETGKKLQVIEFNFKVTSEAYHEITTLLYKNNFRVKVPEKNLDFQATIRLYSTSLTNLYKENQIGDFKLELIEQL